MGWNKVTFSDQKLKKFNNYYYFANSYYSSIQKHTTATSEYGDIFTSVVENGLYKGKKIPFVDTEGVYYAIKGCMDKSADNYCSYCNIPDDDKCIITHNNYNLFYINLFNIIFLYPSYHMLQLFFLLMDDAVYQNHQNM